MSSFFQSIYQSWLERISLDFESGSRIRLKLITETGVQELVRMIRIPWEKTRGIKLEVSFRTYVNSFSINIQLPSPRVHARLGFHWF